MTEHVWLKAVGIAGTIIPVGGALIGLGIYVGNLTNQIEASRAEVQILKGQVTQLQDILQKTQSAATGGRGQRGEKGETGDIGPQGPKGERGPQGEPGENATVDPNEIKRMVSEFVQQNIGSMTANTISASASIETGDVFNTSECIPLNRVKELSKLVFRKGQEYCGADGTLLSTISRVDPDWGLVEFDMPGKGSHVCHKNRPCKVNWLAGKIFNVERVVDDEKGPVALLRSAN